MKLAILICHANERFSQFSHLMGELQKQRAPYVSEVGIFSISDDCQMKVGMKRNDLVSYASLFRAEYVTFIDDDDQVSRDYVKRIIGAIKAAPGKDVYCYRVSYSDGAQHHGTPVYYSIKYSGRPKMETDSPRGPFLRTPNHLMVIRREIAEKCPFPEINNGEDAQFAKDIVKHIKSEYHIDEILYHYHHSAMTTLAQKKPYGK